MHVHSPWQFDAWQNVTADILKYDNKSKISFRHLMHICVKNIRAKIHPKTTWNDGGLDIFWRALTQQEEEQNPETRTNTESFITLIYTRRENPRWTDADGQYNTTAG